MSANRRPPKSAMPFDGAPPNMGIPAGRSIWPALLVGLSFWAAVIFIAYNAWSIRKVEDRVQSLSYLAKLVVTLEDKVKVDSQRITGAEAILRQTAEDTRNNGLKVDAAASRVVTLSLQHGALIETITDLRDVIVNKADPNRATLAEIENIIAKLTQPTELGDLP